MSHEAVVRAIEKCGGEDIHASKIADQFVRERDPERSTDDLLWAAAHRQVRGVARAVLRRQEMCPIDDGHALMYLPLQTHYPRAHGPGEGATYASLDRLTDEDLEFNINRLTAEAQSKNGHARRLAAYLGARRSAAA